MNLAASMQNNIKGYVWLQDVNLLQQGLSFYQLMVVWLASLVGGFQMPLSSVCPMEFALIPEHFVEDSMELLLFAARIPKALDGVNLVRTDPL